MTETNTQQHNGKVLRGVVVSTKMQDTAVVRVDRFVKHPKYEKFIKMKKNYKAHDAGNTVAEGDTVEIRETKPRSKDKTFEIVK